MRTMYSPTHNAAAITTGYLPAKLPPSEQATQMPQTTFSACSPACSPTTPRVTERLVPSQGNRTKDPMQIKSLATCLKTYVIFFSLSPLFTLRRTRGYAQRNDGSHPPFFIIIIFRYCISFYGQRLSGISRCGPG